ncbi:oxidoreductase [Aureivirga marina]|uniref:oxidoreductase n=1 Tax=Aureivirga marina TaxID=1182451 RepID=UPI0018C98B8D|nr:oxidoreductase [Aureivirga marina]
MKQVVIITGASSGIGKATALKLIQNGFQVYGLARRKQNMKEIEKAGGKVFALDITNFSEVKLIIEKIFEQEKRIDILINNAGFAIYGAVEETSFEAAKKQFDVNLFGLAEITKAVLPIMRKQEKGKIINLSSIGGKIHSPLGAWYHASKHAVEGWSDCLRVEVKQFGIDVVIIEPGTIKTEFGKIRNQHFMQKKDSPYQNTIDSMREIIGNVYKEGNYSSPEIVAEIILKSIKAKNPKTRYLVGKKAKQTLFFRKILSDKTLDKAIFRMLEKNKSNRK